MKVKFRRSHRFYPAGQIREIPDHIADSWIQAGIVTAVSDNHLDSAEKPEDKAIAKTRRSAAKKKSGRA